MSSYSIRQLFQSTSVSATCTEFGLTARALRFYEEKGLIEAARDRQNARQFGPAARARLQWIAGLRRAGLTIKDIREVLERDEKGNVRLDFALAKLEQRRLALLRKLDVVETVAAELSMTTPPKVGRARG